MKSYKYETHLHTSEGSACGSSSGAEYIIPYINAGYDGIFVTDHFFGGNTAVDPSLDWKSKIESYCKGYEAALEEAKKINAEKGTDFKVFFGIEQTFNGDDYLVYGLDKNWLLEHPEVENMRHKELFAAVNEAGGLMIQAHPFRLRNYMEAMHIHPREVHGVEIYNAGNKSEENELAELYAKIYDFPVTSGSDIHNIGKVVSGDGVLPVGGMEFELPLNDIFDYVHCIKSKKGKIIR